MYSGLVGELPFVARVALLACFGGLAFVVCAFGDFLLAYAFLAIASLCTTPYSAPLSIETKQEPPKTNGLHGRGDAL